MKPNEVQVGWSLRRRRKTKFWCLSLFVSCPSSGGRSLPSFIDAGSCYIVKVARKEVEDLGGWLGVEGRFGLFLRWRVSKNTIERKIILTRFSPWGGAFYGICLYMVSIVYVLLLWYFLDEIKERRYKRNLRTSQEHHK